MYVFKCIKSTLKVSGKVNSIILGKSATGILYCCRCGMCMCVDNCKRVALCFDDVISSVEAINSQGVQIQVSSGVLVFYKYGGLPRIGHNVVC